jgi:hypothetical protein
MKNITHVLTIYQNLDYRDQLRFYGRTRYEAGNVLIDHLVKTIEFVNRGGEWEEAAIPCFLDTDQNWIELVPDNGRGGGKLYRYVTNDQPGRIYDAGKGLELAAVFFSHALTLGQWEELPIPPEELPAWIVNDPRHFVPERVKTAREAAVTPEPEQLADDPILSQWPDLPDTAEGRPGRSSWHKHGQTLLIFWPEIGKDQLFVAVEISTGVAGAGSSKNMAVYSLLLNKRKLIDRELFYLSERGSGPDDDRKRDSLSAALSQVGQWIADLETYPDTAEE